MEENGFMYIHVENTVFCSNVTDKLTAEVEKLFQLFHAQTVVDEDTRWKQVDITY